MSITVNQTDILKSLLMLKAVKNGTNIAMARAINKTLTGVRTDVVKEIRSDLNVKATVVRESIKLKKAYKTNPYGYLVSKGEPLNLIHFGARQTKKGVTVQVKKRSRRTLIPHAFITTLGFWVGPQVYLRRYDGARSKPIPTRGYAAMPMEYRFPLKRLTGPRIQDVLGNKQVMGPILAAAQKRLTNNFANEVNFILSKVR